jgi:hypothetical protein
MTHGVPGTPVSLTCPGVGLSKGDRVASTARVREVTDPDFHNAFMRA